MDRLAPGDDTNVRSRAARVEKLLRIVCGDAEFPLFVSDDATVFDVCSLLEADIVAKLAECYGIAPKSSDLHEPIWRLVDLLDRDA
jgi:hypothetical protein